MMFLFGHSHNPGRHTLLWNHSLKPGISRDKTMDEKFLYKIAPYQIIGGNVWMLLLLQSNHDSSKTPERGLKKDEQHP